MAEFHDLAERALNLEAGGATAWGNFGDWSAAQSYPDACRALAERLADAAGLVAGDRVMDLGFGCGDQLLLWIESRGVRQLCGLNPSRSQTALAQARLRERGHPALAGALRCAPAESLARQDWPWAPDLILALDCAYHFRDRRAFLRRAAAQLPAGGRLAMTDLVLARPPRGAERPALRLAAAASRIPMANLCSAEQLREDWVAAGFDCLPWQDLTAPVLDGFAAWYPRYRRRLDAAQTRAQRWTKFDVTAAALRWNARHGLLRYQLCVGRRPEI